MTLRLGSTVINVADLGRMTAFWSAALGLVPSTTDADDDFRVLQGSGTNLGLRLSRAPVTARDQMHLDLYTDDQPGEVDRLLALGARHVRAQHRPGDDHVVLADPEGNELCVRAVRAKLPSYVAVVGPSQPALDAMPDADELLDTARDVGSLLAQRRAVVLCGGGSGVMGAVAEGVASRSGTAIGLLPGGDRGEGHPALSFALPTGLGELRNELLVRAADAVVAVGCSWGTLSEIAFAMRTGVPVAAIRCWDLPSGPLVSQTAAEAVDAVLRQQDRAGGGDCGS